MDTVSQPARPAVEYRPRVLAFGATGAAIGRKMNRALSKRLGCRAALSIILAAAAPAALMEAIPAATAQTVVDPATAFLTKNRAAKGVVETASGLQYQVLTPGSGTETPTDQDMALVNYEGRLIDGTTFDKSPQPTPMPITGVVPGFSEALKLMPKGAKYRFWIKPSLGYGSEASGPIPANSVLVFDVEMVDFLPETVVRRMMWENEQNARAPASGAPQAQ